jgi:hypothetical protein
MRHVICSLHVVIYRHFTIMHFVQHTTKHVTSHLSFALHAPHQVCNILLASYETSHLSFASCHYTCNLSLCIFANIKPVTCHLFIVA